MARQIYPPRQCKERISSLLKEPQTGKDIIWTLESGEEIRANCCGTLFYVLLFPKHIEPSGLVILPGDKPGYVNPQVAEYFFEKYFEPERHVRAGVIVGFRDRDELSHVGFMLNKYMFFNQWGVGGDFRVSDVRETAGIPVLYQVKFNQEFLKRMAVDNPQFKSWSS